MTEDQPLKPVLREHTRTEFYYLSVQADEHAAYKAVAKQCGLTLADWARAAVNEYIRFIGSGEHGKVDKQLQLIIEQQPYAEHLGDEKRKAIHYRLTPDEALTLLAFAAKLRARLKREYGFELAGRRGRPDKDTDALQLLMGRVGRAALRWKMWGDAGKPTD